MLNQAEIKSWIVDFLQGTDRFVVDVRVKNDEMILVFLDADTSLTIDHCVEVSRFIESKLDRDLKDFELRVSSAGIDRPLVLHRQYVKNMGRILRLEMNDGSLNSGKLLKVLEDHIVIEKIKEKKKNKVKQVPMEDVISIPFSAIKNALVMLRFN